MPIILEMTFGLIGLALAKLAYKSKRSNRPKDNNENIYGKYFICYTKGKYPEFTYIHWMSRSYITEEEFSYDECEISKLALDLKSNSSLREQGFTGIAMIDATSGEEVVWWRLQDLEF